MIAATLPLAGGVLDGKTKDICSYVYELGRIVKGVWNRCCAAVSFRLRKMVELFRFQLGWSTQGRYKQAAPFNADRCNHATGRVGIILPMYGCAGRFSGYDSIGRHRGQTSEVDCFWKNGLTLHWAVLLRDAIRIASRGGYSR